MTGLVASDITVAFNGRQILKGVSLAFRPGEVTAIVGPNGAGKSTLLTCLVGLRKPQGGEVRLDGQPILALAPRDRARRIGFLPQTPEIAWGLEVETLVSLGRTPHAGATGLSQADHAAVAKALAATDMTAFARRDATTLSGGERARALIARVLAGEPDWLVADEPLAGLDPGHQLDAADLFRGFVAGDTQRGAVLTLHDLGMAARIADRIVVLADGVIIAEGAPDAALTPDVMARAYGVEARYHAGPGGPAFELIGRLKR